MLHHRRRLLLALTPLIIIGLVAAFLALRFAGMRQDRTQAAGIASSVACLDPTTLAPAAGCRLGDGPTHWQVDRGG